VRKREGKQGMGSRVGHGSGNTVGHAGTLKPKQPQSQPLTPRQRAKEEFLRQELARRARGPLQVSLGELLTRKKS